ncbi:hypothetical protein GCM10011314_28670 [Knoellia flava]|uniref:Uncharacterized protein n=1 Tax=Knoellia flava TaxID=913969 RepID=A0A8H9FV86_9MICO|nr:hypothetical protein GCM10011314_28670 [Knoellia flava]
MKFATAAPDGVKRSSGSPVRFPTIVMTVSPAMDQIPFGLVQNDDGYAVLVRVAQVVQGPAGVAGVETIRRRDEGASSA